jgi:hypothetical protein
MRRTFFAAAMSDRTALSPRDTPDNSGLEGAPFLWTMRYAMLAAGRTVARRAGISALRERNEPTG